MSCESKIYVDAIGTVLEVELTEDCTTGLPINSVTVKTITIVRPDGTSFTREGIFSVDGTDGKMYLLSIAGDLTLSGTYYIQAYIELVAWQGTSDIGEFEVFDNLV